MLTVPTQASSLRATPDFAQAVLSEAADLIARAEKRSDERHKKLQAMLDIVSVLNDRLKLTVPRLWAHGMRDLIHARPSERETWFECLLRTSAR